MNVGVIIFPGTNCDSEIEYLYGKLLNCNVTRIWHRETALSNVDLVVLPGGFSHGDYLRTGAMAKLSPIMKSVKAFADRGGKVLGICNGFQILCEAGMLPGVLLENVGLRFLSQFVNVKVEQNSSFFTKNIPTGTVIHCPIAHFQGNYFAEPDVLRKLEDNGQVILRYCSSSGEIEESNRSWNVNGSRNAIAGLANERGNVVGLMPHPERASDSLNKYFSSGEGIKLFEATLSA